MSTSPEFAEHCTELLSSLGPTRARRMFGGFGFYVDDVFVAIATQERLYLKADAQTEARFSEAGCEPFVYEGAGKRVALRYWSAPDDAMESPALMRPWARLALEAGLRARAQPKPGRSPRASRPQTKGRATPPR